MCLWGAVDVPQLAKQSLPTPEVHGSNPIIGKVLLNFVKCQLYWKDENKEKEAVNGPFLKCVYDIDSRSWRPLATKSFRRNILKYLSHDENKLN